MSTTQVLPFPAGFDSGPGGKEYQDRQVYAYHYYCPAVDAAGVPTGEKYCEWFLEKSLEVRMNDGERIGAAMMLTEFGVFSNSDRAVQELREVSSIADRYLQSWAYWDYSVIVSLKLDTHVSHTYPRKIAGAPLSFSHDPATSDFTLVYLASPKAGIETEIFLREDVWYPNGFEVSIKPESAGTWNRVRKNLITIRHIAGIPEGLEITVLIQKKN